jgi:glycosyltransferase involved in cell wall biosynthesis
MMNPKAGQRLKADLDALPLHTVLGNARREKRAVKGNQVSQARKVSIGLPVYNGENYLSKAIESILGQTYEDFELIISDNGSTDRTPEIAATYAQIDRKIRYVRSDVNRGAAWNYNWVFALATGKYFKWAAHDDVIAPEYLKRCVEVLDHEADVVLCYPRSLLIDEQDRFIRNVDDGMNLRHSTPHKRLPHFRPGMCNPVFGLIRSDTLQQTSLIGNYPSSDIVLLWELLLRGQFHEVPERLFYRRYHPKSSVRANPDYRSRAAWFDPHRRRIFYLPTWHQVFKFARAIQRVQMDTLLKAQCYGVLAKQFLLHPRWIVRDFALAFQEMLGCSPMLKRQDLH